MHSIQNSSECAFYLFKVPSDYDKICATCQEKIESNQVVFAHLNPEQQTSFDRAKEVLNNLEEKVSLGRLTFDEKKTQNTAFATLRQITKGAALHPVHSICIETWTSEQLKEKTQVSCPECRQLYYQPTLEDAIYCADPDLLKEYLKIEEFKDRSEILDAIHAIVCITHYLPEHITIIEMLIEALDKKITKTKLEEFLSFAKFNGNVEAVNLLCHTDQFSLEEREMHISEAQKVREKDPERLYAERLEETIQKITPQKLKELLDHPNFTDKKLFIDLIQKSSREDLKTILAVRVHGGV